MRRCADCHVANCARLWMRKRAIEPSTQSRRAISPSRRRMTKSSGAESADEDMELLSQCATGRAATTPSEFETKVANLKAGPPQAMVSPWLLARAVPS